MTSATVMSSSPRTSSPLSSAVKVSSESSSLVVCSMFEITFSIVSSLAIAVSLTSPAETPETVNRMHMPRQMTSKLFLKFMLNLII